MSQSPHISVDKVMEVVFWNYFKIFHKQKNKFKVAFALGYF